MQLKVTLDLDLVLVWDRAQLGLVEHRGPLDRF